MLEGLPPCPNRRGLFVAIEGPRCSGKTHLIDKIKDALGSPEEVVVVKDNGPRTDELIQKGVCVIFEDYLMTEMVIALEIDLKYRNTPVKKAFKKILKKQRGNMVPDLTIYLEPDTATLVNRLIAVGDIKTEEDYIFSNARRSNEYYSKLAHSGILENVVCMTHDPITKETDAINLITMRAAMEMYDRPMKFY